MNLKSVRLNAEARYKLYEHAEVVIDCTEERAAEERAYVKLRTALDAAILRVFPPADKAVLGDYKLVQPVGAIRLPGDEDRVRRILLAFPSSPRQVPEPKREDRFARRPRVYDVQTPFELPESWCEERLNDARVGTLPRSAIEEVSEPMNAWRAAVTAHDEARAKVLRALHALIYKASTLAEVAAVWAPAADLYEQLGGLPDLDDGMLGVIKGAGRKGGA